MFVINFFITFLLLEITARLTKKEAKPARLIFASALGGAYSLIILVNGLNPIFSAVLKVLAALVIVLVSFRFYRLKSVFLTAFVFVFSSFLFLGIIAGVYLVFKSDLIKLNNMTVYFDIGARELVLSAFFAYVLSCLIIRIYNRGVSKGAVYTLTVENNKKCVTLFALSDTGNLLREPFSNSPVIVASAERVKPLAENCALRLIPTSTVSSETFLEAFKPEKITVKASGKTEVVENAYVALGNGFENSEYSAVFNPEILSV